MALNIRLWDWNRDLRLGDTLLINVMLIWVPLIPTTTWSCSHSPAGSNDFRLQFDLIAGIKAAQINIAGLVLSAPSP